MNTHFHVYLQIKYGKMNSVSDIQAFNTLFNEYYPRFIRFALGYIREKQIAEDFVSEAFTIYWENRNQLSPDTKAPAYILTIVKNKCINYLQHLRVRLRAEKEINDHASWRLTLSINTLDACNPDFIFSDEIQQIVDATLQKLPKKTRQVFVLNRYEGFSYKEIAEKLNVSPKTIEFHISKALNQLRLSLKDFICLSPLLFYF